jgi:hypothetical protein
MPGSTLTRSERIARSRAAKALFRKQRALYEQMIRNASTAFAKALRDVKGRAKDDPKLLPHLEKLERKQKTFEATIAAAKVKLREIEARIR